MFQGCSRLLKGVSRVFKWCYKGVNGVSLVFDGYFLNVLGVIKGFFNDVGCFKVFFYGIISMVMGNS